VTQQGAAVKSQWGKEEKMRRDNIEKIVWNKTSISLATAHATHMPNRKEKMIEHAKWKRKKIDISLRK
jgi:hypothetical protein